MNKKEFLIQYVLNRALTSETLDGKLCTEEAIIAWNIIQTETKKDQDPEQVQYPGNGGEHA